MNIPIHTANGITQGTSSGKYEINIKGDKKCVIEAIKVLHLKDNLLSVSQLCDLGYTAVFTKTGWTATHNIESKNMWGPREND